MSVYELVTWAYPTIALSHINSALSLHCTLKSGATVTGFTSNVSLWGSDAKSDSVVNIRIDLDKDGCDDSSLPRFSFTIEL